MIKAASRISPSRLLIAVALCAALWPSTARASAWTWEPWHFYAQLGTAFNFADKRFNIDGDQKNIFVRQFKASTSGANPTPSNFQQLFSDLYFELGIFKRVTFFGDFPFLNSERQKNEGGDVVYSTNGVGDLMFGFRFGLLELPVAIALETRLTFPTGNANALIPLGQGDYRGELRAVASKSFDPVPIYVDFEFGFTLRGNTVISNALSLGGPTVVNYAPEILVHGEVGAKLVRWKQTDRLVLALAVEHRQSTSRPADNMEGAFTTIIPETSSLTTFGANVIVYFIRNLGVNLRFAQAVAGSRLPDITSVGAGIFGTY